MEELYQNNGQMQWPSSLDELDELQRYYDPPLQVPFGYNGASMPSDSPFQPENHIMATHGTSVVQQVHHQSIDHGAPVTREADCQDPSSRPRLTTEQTNILESKFQQDPKPPTETKKELAQKIGLTLDKVNNWYQNRRAKAKNAKKNMETFGVLPANENNTNWQYPSEYPNSSYLSPQSHTAAPVASMSAPVSNSVNEINGNVTQEVGFTTQQVAISQGSAVLPTSEMPGPTVPPQSFDEQLLNGYLEMAARFPSSWIGSDNMERGDMGQAHLMSTLRRIEENNVAMEVIQRTNRNQSITYPSQIEAPQPTSPLPEWVGDHSRSLSPWTTPLVAAADWSIPHHQDGSLEHQMLLQQSAVPDLIQSYDSEQQASSMESSISSQRAPSTQSPESICYPATLLSNNETFYQSPSPTPFTSLAQPQPERVVARRGSGSSELANNFDTIHLQKVQSHQSQNSQQNPDEKVFKTPQLPQMSLAQRRKKRPEALGAIGVRSQSCIGPEHPSPLSKTMSLGSASSVRRIKSTGNSLNVIGSRVQKSGFASAQRSPLNFSTFQEAEAMHHINQYGAPSPNSRSVSTNGQVPMTPHTPATINEQTSTDWSKSLAHSTSNPNMFQHQQFQAIKFDNAAASPPGTPFQHLPAYMSHPHAHMMAPPQSAPAHITHFPNFSPPFQAMPGTPAGYFPPVPMPQDSFQYPPMQHGLPGPVYGYQPGLDMYGFQQPHIVNNSPPFPGFFGIPPPPPPIKELEVVMTTFPKPAESASPPKEPHRPKQFTFQNSGPQDF